jgi:Fur family ferric uptake transcriptional regulator
MEKATVDQILKQYGLKITTARKLVVASLQMVSKPVTAEELQKIVGQEVDPATTYRVLQKLVEKGVVYQTDFRDRKAYYEYQGKHHHHVVCTKCGTKEETDICIDTKKVSKNLKNFARLNSHILEFFGVCNKCSSC